MPFWNKPWPMQIVSNTINKPDEAVLALCQHRKYQELLGAAAVSLNWGF